MGEAESATKLPNINDKMESATTNFVVLEVTLPVFLISVFRWGFQWGTSSRTKWLPKASGIAIKGLGIALAIAAATTVCGVSSTVKLYYT